MTSWTVISGVSFEPRSGTLIKHLVGGDFDVQQTIALRIDDRHGDHAQEIQDRTDGNQRVFDSNAQNLENVRADLMEPPSKWVELVRSLCHTPNRSILLDVSTLPKRVALFILRQLLRNENAKDILLCYTHAEEYKEGPLSYDERPPASLPGFGATESEDKKKAFIVSVGYSRLDLREVLKESSSPDIHFLMPFPPASPSFRRTWRFLNSLSEDLAPARPILHRFHAADAFATYEWLVGNMSTEVLTTMIPLGPKPHSIAMALAQMTHPDNSQLVYPQPQRYYPDYSSGVRVEQDGRPSITAYALRRNHRNVLGEIRQ